MPRSPPPGPPRELRGLASGAGVSIYSVAESLTAPVTVTPDGDGRNAESVVNQGLLSGCSPTTMLFHSFRAETIVASTSIHSMSPPPGAGSRTLRSRRNGTR